MPDISPDNATAIVASVLGTVSILTTGAVALGKHLQTIFFAPLLAMLREYLKKQSKKDEDLIDAMERLEKEVASFPRCPHANEKAK